MLFACTDFKPGINERRLTLGLNHEGTLTKTSKPLQPHAYSFIIVHG